MDQHKSDETLEERLKAYLQAQMPQAGNVTVFNLHRPGGIGYSREHWLFDAQWEENGQIIRKGFYLRRDPTGSVLETEREPEFRAIKALEKQDLVPVPKAYWLDTSGRWLDRPFIIMERYEGTVDRWMLNSSAYPLELRKKMAQRYTELLAYLHSLDWKALGLSFLGVPEGPKGAAKAEIEKWEKYLARQALEPHPVFAEAFHWLRKHMPEAEHTTLLHGHWMPGNSIFRGDQVVVVIDWEMIHLGDPMEDLGWMSQGNWYRQNFIPDVWDFKEYYELYEKITGFKVNEESVHFYRVLSALKLGGVGLTGIKSFCENRTDRPTLPNVGNQDIVAKLIGLKEGQAWY